MPITTTITDLPTAPSRQDPTTFSDRADAWVSSLDGFVTETNTLAGEIEAEGASAVTAAETAEANAQSHASTALGHANDAAASATDAQTAASESAASANFVGLWSGLTGALNTPASVAHNNSVWILLNNLADVTTSEPGVSADWQSAAPAPVQDIQTFTSSGVWTKPEGATFVYVEVIGGGGGGNGFSGTYSSNNATYSGGAGGEYLFRLFVASSLASSISVTVGAGGNGSTSTTGGNGGSSSFGSLMSGRGGRGGGTNRGTLNLRDPNTNDDSPPWALYFAGKSSGANGSQSRGHSVYGGAGGASYRNGLQFGGTSEFAGDGGFSIGDDGAAPGGGGGCGDSTVGGGGNGGVGQVTIYSW